MNVTKPRRIRRTHSAEFKRSLIEACGEPGASVAGVALADANQLRRWMRERGIEPPELSCLRTRPDEAIDSSNIPTSTPAEWRQAQIRQFCRPLKKPFAGSSQG